MNLALLLPLLGLSICMAFINIWQLTKGVHTWVSRRRQPKSGTSPNPPPSESLHPSPNLSGFLLSPNPFPTTSLSKSPPELPTAQREMPVIGFRCWRVVTGFKLGVGPLWALGSLNPRHGHWAPGANTATCCGFDAMYSRPRPALHQSPNPHCECGYYVVANLDPVS